MTGLRLLLPSLAMATLLLAGCEDWNTPKMPDPPPASGENSVPPPTEP